MKKEHEVRTPNHGIMMCTAKRGPEGEIRLVKEVGRRREEVPLDVFLRDVYKAVYLEQGDCVSFVQPICLSLVAINF